MTDRKCETHNTKMTREGCVWCAADWWDKKRRRVR